MAAACLSRTQDLETHLAPLATTLAETNLPNEASVDCVAFFLQVTAVLLAVGRSVGSCTATCDWVAYANDSSGNNGRGLAGGLLALPGAE